MLKTLVIVAAVILGLTVYVAVQNQRAAEQAVHESHHNPEAATPSLDHQKPQENNENSQGNSPSWYGFFTWPNSTTTWAILLTLWAITWQAIETRKASEASRDSIRFLISKDRARLELKIECATWQTEKEARSYDTPVPFVEFRIANLGPTHAFNCRLLASYVETDSENPVSMPAMEEVQTRQTMKAGSRDCHPDFPLNLKNVREIIDGTGFLQMATQLTYTDVFGEDRESAIRYVYANGEWTEKENRQT